MKNYDGPLYAQWSAVVKGRGFDPVEKRKKEQTSYLPHVLMLGACFLFGIGIIIAGYFKGNMHIEAVYKSLTNFT